MKTLLLNICLILTSIFSYGQTIAKGLNPTGLSMSYAPGITLNNSTAQTTIYLDTIPANTFVPGRKYEFNIYCSITTPATLAPTLSINVMLGSTTLNLISTAALGISQTKKNFRIRLLTTAYSTNSQYMIAEVYNDNTGVLLGSTYLSKSMSLTEDLTVNKAMKVTAQFSSAINLATTTLYIDSIYKENF